LKLIGVVGLVLLLVSLFSNAYLFGLAQDNAVMKRLTDLGSQVSALGEYISVLEANNTVLDDRLISLEANNSDLSLELAAVQVDLSRQVAPKIVTRLGVRDCNWDSSSMRLYISGQVWNVGTETAKNCTLHVTLYQGTRVANNTLVDLGTLEVGSWRDIAANIRYTGSALTSWSVVPEFS
jgi:hypothetical protein